MPPRAKRIRRAAFPAALEKAKRFSSAHFSYVLPASSTGYAVIVSKAVARSSVARHRVKRRAFEALKRLPTAPSGLILYARAGAPELTFAQTLAELRAAISRVR